ncbi:hypothetical protein AB8O64_35980 (plasmid) [Streptomyces sp. QH1-20]|uniref:hypothetical protein n=1 Tax=Streptomyces sp. QH1-20 TaxID=3240934 RepID=UPI0035178B7A
MFMRRRSADSREASANWASVFSDGWMKGGATEGSLNVLSIVPEPCSPRASRKLAESQPESGHTRGKVVSDVPLSADHPGDPSRGHDVLEVLDGFSTGRATVFG